MKKLFILVLVLPVATFLVWRFLVLMIPADEHRYVSLDTGALANSSWKGRAKRVGSFNHGADLCVRGVCHMKLKPHRRKHRGLSIAGDQIFLNGKPFRILGGSFHYFRTQPHQWIDRLEKLKAAGLNTVTTCIPWNLHERVRGEYKFSGRWKLVAFVKLVRKMGLHLIVQPGPYVSAEWELGGLPAWLLHDPNMKVCTSKCHLFLQHVERYFDQLLPLLTEHTCSNGGPIIGFQVENEFGNHGLPDDAYMEFLFGMLTKHGLKEMYFTSTNAFTPKRLQRGFRNDVLATVKINNDPLQALGRLKKFQPNKPLMVMELFSGWFDTWGKNHSTLSGTEFFKTVNTLLSMNASINFHMFIGGTNFGFWNGGSFGGTPTRQFMPTTTSYDYDALVSESGDCHPTKYKALRTLLTKHKLVSTPLPHFPQNTSKGAYDSVPVKDTVRMEEFVKLLHDKPTWLSRPTFMEYLNISNHGGQAFGWILYRTSYDFGNRISIDGVIHNRAQIFLNGHLVKSIYNKLMKNISADILVDFKFMKDKGNALEILVENMGRVSNRMLDVQRRGFEGNVTAGGKLLSTWEHLSLDFSEEFIATVVKNARWMPYAEHNFPSLYRGQLNVRHLHDTFLDMRRWTKGIAIVNGYNIGRYWNIGPQQMLYIPKPLLKKGRNEIIIFELEKPGSKLEFLAQAILNSVTVMSTKLNISTTV